MADHHPGHADRRGLTEILIGAAVEYAAAQGAQIVESYPLRAEITKLLPYERYMGIQSTFERAGFVPVAQRSARRPIMRYYIGDTRLAPVPVESKDPDVADL